MTQMSKNRHPKRGAVVSLLPGHKKNALENVNTFVSKGSVRLGLTPLNPSTQQKETSVASPLLLINSSKPASLSLLFSLWFTFA